MNPDETAIYEYLKGWPRTFISGRVIAREACRARYEEDRYWAVPVLAGMVCRKWVETDSAGHFRLKPPEPKAEKPRRHISPVYLRILKYSGRSFDKSFINDSDDLPPQPPNFSQR